MDRTAGANKSVSTDGCVWRRRGTATVELAIILPVVLFLLFSIIELGLMIKKRTELGHAARESARLAAVGSTPTRMSEGVNSSLTTTRTDGVVRDYQYRRWDEETGTWGNWTTLGVDGTENNAAAGDQIRVRIDYDHGLLVPGLMGPVLNADDDGNVHLSGAAVMMRE
ncbi:MAG: TadE/TadG family type IV pilus assembly protein [Armatimonadota bacterium]